jgi:hypothetical protein
VSKKQGLCSRKTSEQQVVERPWQHLIKFAMVITVPSLNYAVITVRDFVVAKRCNRSTGGSSAVCSVCLIQEVQSSAIKVT